MSGAASCSRARLVEDQCCLHAAQLMPGLLGLSESSTDSKSNNSQRSAHAIRASVIAFAAQCCRYAGVLTSVLVSSGSPGHCSKRAVTSSARSASQEWLMGIAVLERIDTFTYIPTGIQSWHCSSRQSPECGCKYRSINEGCRGAVAALARYVLLKCPDKADFRGRAVDCAIS